MKSSRASEYGYGYGGESKVGELDVDMMVDCYVY